VEAKALGITTLHIAATKGYVELAEVLLSHGADVNAAGNSRGSTVTPLAVALRAKQDRMVEFLKSRGGRA
jgi:ankyrin repeat protein